MATLDVTEVTICAEFADAFQVLRRPETVDAFGRSIPAQVVATALGTIYPTGDNSLVRKDDYQGMRKTLTVVTPYRLQGPAPGFQPDMIHFRGTEYVVSNVQDFSQFGFGFVVAEVSSVPAIPAPPLQ